MQSECSPDGGDGRWPSDSICGDYGRCLLNPIFHNVSEALAVVGNWSTVTTGSPPPPIYRCRCDDGWISQGDFLSAPYAYCHVHSAGVLSLWCFSLFLVSLICALYTKAVHLYLRMRKAASAEAAKRKDDDRGTRMQIANGSTLGGPTPTNASLSKTKSLWHSFVELCKSIATNPTRRTLFMIGIHLFSTWLLCLVKIIGQAHDFHGNDPSDSQMIGYHYAPSILYVVAMVTYLFAGHCSSGIWLISAMAFYPRAEAAKLRVGFRKALVFCVLYDLWTYAIVIALLINTVAFPDSSIYYVSEYSSVEIMAMMHFFFKGYCPVACLELDKTVSKMVVKNMRIHQERTAQMKLRAAEQTAAITVKANMERQHMTKSTNGASQVRIPALSANRSKKLTITHHSSNNGGDVSPVIHEINSGRNTMLSPTSYGDVQFNARRSLDACNSPSPVPPLPNELNSPDADVTGMNEDRRVLSRSTTPNPLDDEVDEDEDAPVHPDRKHRSYLVKSLSSCNELQADHRRFASNGGGLIAAPTSGAVTSVALSSMDGRSSGPKILRPAPLRPTLIHTTSTIPPNKVAPSSPPPAPTPTSAQSTQSAAQDDHQEQIGTFIERLHKHTRTANVLAYTYVVINAFFAFLPYLRPYVCFLLPLQLTFALATAKNVLLTLMPQNSNKDSKAKAHQRGMDGSKLFSSNNDKSSTGYTRTTDAPSTNPPTGTSLPPPRSRATGDRPFNKAHTRKPSSSPVDEATLLTNTAVENCQSPKPGPSPNATPNFLPLPSGSNSIPSISPTNPPTSTDNAQSPTLIYQSPSTVVPSLKTILSSTPQPIVIPPSQSPTHSPSNTSITLDDRCNPPARAASAWAT